MHNDLRLCINATLTFFFFWSSHTTKVLSTPLTTKLFSLAVAVARVRNTNLVDKKHTKRNQSIPPRENARCRNSKGARRMHTKTPRMQGSLHGTVTSCSSIWCQSPVGFRRPFGSHYLSRWFFFVAPFCSFLICAQEPVSAPRLPLQDTREALATSVPRPLPGWSFSMIFRSAGGTSTEPGASTKTWQKVRCKEVVVKTDT